MWTYLLPGGERTGASHGCCYTLNTDDRGLIHSTQDELGFASGVSRITVSRFLRDFAQKGWLKTGYRTLKIADLDALRQFASG
jgi:CRP-like cAMP-binding protein